MAGAGFEPAKAEPTRLQRVPFDRSGTPPGAVQEFRAYRPRAGTRLLALGGFAQLLGVWERLQLLERPALDLADPLARDVEGVADFLKRA